ncbi:MAG: hypothetical protein C0412_12805 [Flavobacterium sp.]|nr:hypothetical protein [Flavobacterium sp.]
MTQEQFQFDIHTREQILSTRFNYWNALLLFNTIIIATFSVLITVDSKLSSFYSIIILVSLLSSFLLVLNYRITKRFLDKNDSLDDFEKMLPFELLKQMWIVNGQKKKKNVQNVETVCEIIFLIQVLLIIYVSFKNFFDNLFGIVKT